MLCFDAYIKNAWKPILCALCLFLALKPVAAEAPVRILGLEAKYFPQIRLQVRIREAHPDFIRNKQKIKLQIFEIYDEEEKKIQDFQMQALPEQSRPLQLVWLIDSSLSMKQSRFKDAVVFSRAMLQELDAQDRVALYSVKERPYLLSDFSSDRVKLDAALATLIRDAKKTRIYDALYSALYSAQSALHSSIEEQTERQVALVLLTDGREEDSFLSDEDCYELSNMGKDMNIPIYVLLFNGLAAGPMESKHSASLSPKKHLLRQEQLLQRLAVKTGGFFQKQSERSTNYSKENEKLLERLRRAKAGHDYEVRYQSSYPLTGWPAKKIVTRLLLDEGNYAAIASFRVPWSILFAKGFPLLWLLSGAILAVLGIVIYFSRRRRESFYADESTMWDMKKEQQTKPMARAQERLSPVVDLGDSLTAAQQSKEQARESYEDWKREGKLEDAGLSRAPVDPVESFLDDPLPPPASALALQAPGMLLEDERSLYLREHSYRMLQLALRNAARYKKAALHSRIHADPPKQRIYDLFLETTLIGSGRWAHIPVRDSLASPVHARIKKVDDRFVIYDLMSASGIYLNGRKILRPLSLKHGDEIRIGRSYFTFTGERV